MVKLLRQEAEETESIKVKVVGVGNAGSKIISRISGKIEGATLVAFNTDANALRRSKADIKIQLGEKTTLGMGTGQDPEKGKFAAHEDKEKISEALKNSHIVFLVAGLGGGTGTGSAPVIANKAKEQEGAIVISIATTPFEFEGQKRLEHAQKGLEVLERNVDTLIHINNQKLCDIVDEKTTMTSAFDKVDEMVLSTITSLSDLIYKEKILDIDFADISSIVKDAGRGIVGLGSSKGEDRMANAARGTIEHPLIEKNDMMEAKNILISITGSEDLTLKEVGDAMNIIQGWISSPSKVLGVAIDPHLENEVKITLLATGIGNGKKPEPPSKKPAEERKPGELPLTKDEDTHYNIDEPAFMRKKRDGIL